MSAKVNPICVRGVATLTDIALRASSNVPPRHRPNSRVAKAVSMLADTDARPAQTDGAGGRSHDEWSDEV